MIALQTKIQKFVKSKLDYAYEISFLSRVKCFGGNCGFSNALGYQLVMMISETEILQFLIYHVNIVKTKKNGNVT